MAEFAVKPLQLVGRHHDALRTPAVDVDDWDMARALAERMRVTLRRRDGAGLAACQVGRPLNLVVLDRRLGDHAYANVALIKVTDRQQEAPEGCLSLPGRWYTVPRYTKIKVRAFDIDQEDAVELNISDAWQARMWQHENDHLLGLLLSARYDECRAPK